MSEDRGLSKYLLQLVKAHIASRVRKLGFST